MIADTIPTAVDALDPVTQGAWTDMLLCGDVLAQLARLPDGCVQTCVTSPPYWGLRDYGVAGAIGLEATPDQFVARMVEVFREVRRVLRADGTCWLNLGDSYATHAKGHNGFGSSGLDANASAWQDEVSQHRRGDNRYSAPSIGLKDKDLCGMPWRVAFALQADGWWLRCDIIWHKPNPMPESVSDRPTKAHEYLFLLTKQPTYYYDAEAVREPAEYGRRGGTEWSRARHGDPRDKRTTEASTVAGGDASGRNKRSVWTIATEPYRGAHFATYPRALVQPCVLAGSPPRCCERCGAPWERVVETTPMIVRHGPKAGGYGSRTTDGLSGTMVAPASSVTTGWQPTCRCVGAIGSGRALVLDPFAGSGTTLAVAKALGRSYLGIELNPKYVTLAERRLARIPFSLWPPETLT